MTMLYSGNGTIRFPVAAGNSLKIRNLSGVETVTGSSAGREDASSSIGAGFVVYGPQSADTTITLSTTGVCDYQVVVGDPTPSTSTSSATTGMQALKAVLAAATPRPFLQEKFIQTIPAWSAKTYRYREVVQNGGNMYAVLGDNLVSAVAPTGTSTKPTDPDGTGFDTDKKGWVYLGPVRQDTTLNAEIASYQQLSTAPSGLTAFGWNDTTCPINRIPFYKLDPSGFVDFNAGSNTLVPYASTKDPDVHPLGGPSNSFTMDGFSGFTIITDELSMGWRSLDYISGGPDDWGFKIDDVDYNPSSPFVAVNTNLYRQISFNWRRLRKIKIKGGGKGFTHFYFSGPNAIVIPDEDGLSRAWLDVGDSYKDGAAPGSVVKYGQWSSHIARELGLPYPVMAAVSGVGFVTKNALGNYLQRLQADEARHKEKNYLFALFQQSGNDGTTSATLNQAYKDKVKETLAYTRNTLLKPTTPIFVTSTCNADTVTAGTSTLAISVMNQCITELGDPYIFLIPMGADMAGGVSLLNPTSRANYLGASDIHPWDSGSWLLGKYVANQIRGIVNKATS